MKKNVVCTYHCAQMLYTTQLTICVNIWVKNNGTYLFWYVPMRVPGLYVSG